MSSLDDLEDLKESAEAEAKKAAAQLAIATHAHLVEKAQEKLHTRRGMFIEALSHFPIDADTWVVNLDANARWIDEGMEAHDMLDDLLKSKSAKRAKDGSTYVIIPFQQNKAKQQMSPAQQSLLATIKKEMAAVGATPNGIESDSSGVPKEGLVRSLDIMKAPLSTNSNPIGRGVGRVAQGPTGIPLLSGVKVYQKKIKDKDGNEKMGRFVMTFRVASSKQKDGPGPGETTAAWKKKQTDKDGKTPNQQRWQHPGLEATNLMEEALEWAKQEWAKKIAPALMDRLVASIS
jgi:ribosomal protein S16